MAARPGTEGVAGLPTPSDMYMNNGGIVGFQNRGLVVLGGRTYDLSTMSPEQQQALLEAQRNQTQALQPPPPLPRDAYRLDLPWGGPGSTREDQDWEMAPDVPFTERGIVSGAGDLATRMMEEQNRQAQLDSILTGGERILRPAIGQMETAASGGRNPLAEEILEAGRDVRDVVGPAYESAVEAVGNVGEDVRKVIDEYGNEVPPHYLYPKGRQAGEDVAGAYERYGEDQPSNIRTPRLRQLFQDIGGGISNLASSAYNALPEGLRERELEIRKSWKDVPDRLGDTVESLKTPKAYREARDAALRNMLGTTAEYDPNADAKKVSPATSGGAGIVSDLRATLRGMLGTSEGDVGTDTTVKPFVKTDSEGVITEGDGKGRYSGRLGTKKIEKDTKEDYGDKTLNKARNIFKGSTGKDSKEARSKKAFWEMLIHTGVLAAVAPNAKNAADALAKGATVAFPKYIEQRNAAEKAAEDREVQRDRTAATRESIAATERLGHAQIKATSAIAANTASLEFTKLVTETSADPTLGAYALKQADSILKDKNFFLNFWGDDVSDYLESDTGIRFVKPDTPADEMQSHFLHAPAGLEGLAGTTVHSKEQLREHLKVINAKNRIAGIATMTSTPGGGVPSGTYTSREIK